MKVTTDDQVIDLANEILNNTWNVSSEKEDDNLLNVTVHGDISNTDILCVLDSEGIFATFQQ